MNTRNILCGLLAAVCFSSASAHHNDDLNQILGAVVIGGIVYQAMQPREVIVVPPPRYVRPMIEDCGYYRSAVQYRNCLRRNDVEQYRADRENESRYQRSLQSGHYRYEYER